MLGDAIAKCFRIELGVVIRFETYMFNRYVRVQYDTRTDQLSVAIGSVYELFKSAVLLLVQYEYQSSSPVILITTIPYRIVRTYGTRTNYFIKFLTQKKSVSLVPTSN